MGSVVVQDVNPHFKQRRGFLHDPNGDKSSKRLESLSAFIEASLCPFLLPILQGYVNKKFGLGVNIPIFEITMGLLSYSAILQGIAWGAERGMNPTYMPTQSPIQQGQNQSQVAAPVKAVASNI
jgi:hypothetical protein